MTYSIIHGENALIPIKEMPAGKTSKHTSFIVGHSESGHNHVLEADKTKDFDIMIENGEIYITNKFEASLVHKKTHDIHETVVVQPGIYKVNRKTEYDPFNKIVRNVFD